MEMLFRDIKKHLATIDWFLVICVCAALGFGLLAVRSATNFFYLRPDLGNQARALTVQVTAIVIGLIAMVILSKSDYMHILKYWKPLYIISVILLAGLHIFGVGGEAGVGNRSWYRFAGVGIQPSEFVKIVFIMTLANQLDKNQENINGVKNIIMLCLYLLIPFGLILSVGDLGNGMIYTFIFLTMCFAAGISLWYFLGGAFIMAALSPLLWNWELIMPEYRQRRVLEGFDPAIPPGWQVQQSIRAIGSGGLLGQGYEQGILTQRGMVPAQWTDFIFSTIGEEFGFVGAISVLIILTLIIVRIFIAARRARNNLGSLICMGIMAMFIAQTVINIGMCLGMLPVIGVTLPFFSYGGSSVLSLLLSIGIVLSVNSRKNMYYFTREDNLDK